MSNNSTTPEDEEKPLVDAKLAAFFAELDALGPGNGKSLKEIEDEMYGEFGEPI